MGKEVLATLTLVVLDTEHHMSDSPQTCIFNIEAYGCHRRRSALEAGLGLFPAGFASALHSLNFGIATDKERFP